MSGQVLLTSRTADSAVLTPRSRHKWLALSMLALAQFLVVLDASIVNIALPVLGQQLHLSTAGLAWVITSYVLAFGGFLLLGGRLADRYGHRRVFLWGVAGFVVASALAGLSINSGMLLAARALQGASAAMLAPAALALLTQLFLDSRERTKALGVWGGVAAVGAVGGVLLGGVLTSAFGWHSVFFVNVPIGALVLLAVPFLIRHDVVSARAKLDMPGAVTVTGSLVATVGALSAAEQVGFLEPLTIGLSVAAITLAVVFVFIERRSAQPLVPLTVFRNRNLSVGNTIILLMGAAMVPLFFALSVFMQAVLRYDALTTGLTQLPLAGALVVVAGAAPSAIGALGAKRALIASLVLLAAGLVWLSFAPANASFLTHLLGPSLVIGAGLGGAFVTATQLAVDGVGGRDAGLAGGLVNSSQQIGGALGLAALSTIATLRTDNLVHAGSSTSQALTGGFSWLFLGAAALSLAAAGVASRSRPAGGEGLVR